MRTESRRLGFTLIELLVVVAVLAILISILLPSLSGAREAGRAVTCGSNMRAIAQGLATYNAENDNVYPASYMYGSREHGGSWRVEDQQETNPVLANGYIHWSYYLFEGEGGVAQKAFECPTVTNGGAPATNPGPDPRNWESWQVNDTGGGPGSATPHDRQARRMAYTGNGAIFPRNKYRASTVRKNRFVNASAVSSPGRVILAGEFLDYNNWTAIAEIGGGGAGEASQGRSKSHRPVTPFIGGSSSDVYNEADRPIASFFYPSVRAIVPNSELRGGLIEGASDTSLNALGRHHSGGSRTYGGTTNYVFVDGHVEKLTIVETIRKRLWGDRFYAITGNNRVSDRNPDGSNPADDRLPNE